MNGKGRFATAIGDLIATRESEPELTPVASPPPRPGVAPAGRGHILNRHVGVYVAEALPRHDAGRLELRVKARNRDAVGGSSFARDLTYRDRR